MWHRKQKSLMKKFKIFSNFRHIPNIVFLFWVILRCLNFMSWRFGRHCPFHFHRTSYEDGAERTHKVQTQGNHPKERTQIKESLNLGKSPKFGAELLFLVFFLRKVRWKWTRHFLFYFVYLHVTLLPVYSSIGLEYIFVNTSSLSTLESDL